MSAAENHRFEELLSRYLDERLTPDEEAELLELLQDPARERTFVELTRIDREIADHLALPISDEKMVELVREDIAPPGPAPRVGRRSRRLAAAALAAALLLTAGALFWLLRQEAPTPLPLAHLEQVTGEVRILTPDAQPVARAGQELLSGQGLQLIGVDSAAVVRYPDGTRLEVGADTLITELSDGPESGKRVLLAEGYLTADVAKQPAGRPMVLTTPLAEILVLGTSLSLSNGAATTYVEIDKGKVQLTRKSDGQSTVVATGYDAIVTPGVEPLVSQKPLRFYTPRHSLPGHSAVTLSPDGKTMATWGSPLGTAVLWDTATMQQRVSLQAEGVGIGAAAFAPDSRTLATGDLDRTVRLWDSTTGRLRNTFGEQAGAVSAVMFSSDGRTLAVLAGPEKTVTLWDVMTGRQLAAPQSYPCDVVAFSPDLRTLATARAAEPTVTLYDLTTGQLRASLRRIEEHTTVSCLGFSPDGRRLALGSFKGGAGGATVWDLPTGRARYIPAKPQCLAFSPDATQLALGHWVSATLWDIDAGKKLATFYGHTKRAHCVVFAPDGKTLAVGADPQQEGSVRLWDLPVTSKAP